MKTATVCLMCVLAGPAPVSAADDAVLLRHQPVKNRPVLYRVKTALLQKQSIGDVNLDTKITTEEVFTWTLTKIDEKGRLHWRKDNKRLKAAMSVQPLGKFEYDSKSRERDKASQLGTVLTPICENLTQAFLRVTAKPTGEIVQVREYEELVGKLVKDNPFAAQFTFGGTNQGVRLLLQEMNVVFSKKPVRRSDSWSVDYEMDLPKLGRITGVKRFRYLRSGTAGKRKVVRIGFSYSLTMDTKFDFAGVKGEGTLQVKKSSGIAQIDLETGQVVSLKSQIEFGGKPTVVVGDKSYEMPTKQTWKVHVERLDKQLKK